MTDGAISLGAGLALFALASAPFAARTTTLTFSLLIAGLALSCVGLTLLTGLTSE
jgi:hypothetical protein